MRFAGISDKGLNLSLGVIDYGNMLVGGQNKRLRLCSEQQYGIEPPVPAEVAQDVLHHVLIVFSAAAKRPGSPELPRRFRQVDDKPKGVPHNPNKNNKETKCNIHKIYDKNLIAE